MCVIPLFKYSAPLIPWSENQLIWFDRQWAQCTRASIKVNSSTDSSIMFLHPSKGGLGTPSASHHMAKELGTHIKQCTLQDDETSRLIRSRALILLERASSRTMHQAACTLETNKAWEPYLSSPIFRLQQILTQANSAWINLDNKTTLVSRWVVNLEWLHAPSDLPQTLETIIRTLKQTHATKLLYPLEDQSVNKWTTAEALIYTLHTLNI